MFTIKNYELHPELYYSPQRHLWLKIENNCARVGFDPLEQETKGALVVVQLDEAGKTLKEGESFGSVEAEKHVGMLHSPVSGKIVNVNQDVIENPRLANTDPYQKGWFIEIELDDFEKEKTELITGEVALRAWYEAEIKKYEDWGWLAEV